MAPLERYYRLPPARRAALLDAARSEFAEHGFERASYNRSIAAAGVSKGAMYYYFADKEDLFGEVIDHLLDELSSQTGPLRTPTDAEDFWAALRDWTSRCVRVFLGQPELASIGRSFWHASGAERTAARLRQLV